MFLFSRSTTENTLSMEHPRAKKHTIRVPKTHFVNGNPMTGPLPKDHEEIFFGMGCFWGAERVFWKHLEIFVTAAGYMAGNIPNPTYEEVCSGKTGHNEVVRVVFNPQKLPLLNLIKAFWENHDPTQGMRQGNDIGDQYRSGVYCSTQKQLEVTLNSKRNYQDELSKAGWGTITTEIARISEFYFAEEYHQQYLAKIPHGYCGLGGTGVSMR